MKKFLSLILALVVLAGSFSFVANGVVYRDNFPNTHRNTGGNTADLIAVAKTQIGYTELSTSTGKPLSPNQNGGYTKYGAWFGAPTTAWCAFFVAWCSNQANISTSVIPRIGNCASLVSWFSKRGRYFNKINFTPKAGDLIFYNWGGGSTANHIGIVTGLKGNEVYVIEGNTGGVDGFRVEAKSRKKNSGSILGYARPAYNDGSTYIGSYSFAAYAASKYASGSYTSGSGATTSSLAVITATAESVTADSATLMGRINNSSSYGVSSSGFYFGNSKDSLKKKKVKSYTKSKSVSLSLEVDDLTVDKTYYYCTYAVIKGKTYKGPVYSFTTVDDRPRQIVLSENTVTLGIGETGEVFSAVLPLNASDKDIRWLSSNELVATADNGIIKGHGAGTSVITVKSDYSNASAQCMVTVTLCPASAVVTENVTEESILVRWENKNVHDLAGYAVYRATSLDGIFTCIGKTNETKFLDKNLQPGEKYYYKVQCLGVSEEFNSTLSEPAKESARLPAPVITSVSQQNSLLHLNWGSVDKADTYYIYRSEEDPYHYRLIGKSESTFFTDSEIRNGKTYYYTVAAENQNGASRLSAEAHITCSEISRPQSDFITRNFFTNNIPQKLSSDFTLLSDVLI